MVTTKHKMEDDKMDLEKLRLAVDEVCVPIDILQATTEFYKGMEAEGVENIIKLNEIVWKSLREEVDKIVYLIKVEGGNKD